jgi:hypothetical protein
VPPVTLQTGVTVALAAIEMPTGTALCTTSELQFKGALFPECEATVISNDAPEKL